MAIVFDLFHLPILSSLEVLDIFPSDKGYIYSEDCCSGRPVFGSHFKECNNQRLSFIHIYIVTTTYIHIIAMSIDKSELRLVREKPNDSIITYVSTFNPKQPELFHAIQQNLPIFMRML